MVLHERKVVVFSDTPTFHRNEMSVFRLSVLPPRRGFNQRRRTKNQIQFLTAIQFKTDLFPFCSWFSRLYSWNCYEFSNFLAHVVYLSCVKKFFKKHQPHLLMISQWVLRNGEHFFTQYGPFKRLSTSVFDVRTNLLCLIQA